MGEREKAPTRGFFIWVEHLAIAHDPLVIEMPVQLPIQDRHEPRRKGRQPFRQEPFVSQNRLA
jgi:hypothetical protein